MLDFSNSPSASFFSDNILRGRIGRRKAQDSRDLRREPVDRPSA